MTSREIFVVGTARTAIGTFGGALKDVPNTQLATTALKRPSNAAVCQPRPSATS